MQYNSGSNRIDKIYELLFIPNGRSKIMRFLMNNIYEKIQLESYQLRNLPRLSFELLCKTPPEFCSVPPVQTLQYVCQSGFQKSKTSRRLSSYLCFAECFCF